MNFHFCCVVLALAVSSSTAMPVQCTIPAVEHGQVGRYTTKIFQNDRFRECFTQVLTGEKIPDSDSGILRCEKGYLPAGSSQISKVLRLKEDVVACEDGTWSKPLRCEAEITCGEPPPIEYAATISLFTEDYPLGSIVAYECQSGYAIKGRTTASQCIMSDDGSQAVWTKAPMSCVAQSCGDPGIVINARRIGSDFTFPHTAEYECEEGYKLNGTGVRHCEPGGMWSGKLPTCERIFCDRPRNPENGNVSFISLEYGTELRYECNKGFNLSNHQQRRCIGNGTWSSEAPVCKEVTCDDPQVPDNGFRQLTDGLKVDSSVIYSCADGKTLVGASTSKCLIDGHWTFSPPECVDISCGEPPPIDFGTVTSLFTKEYPLGATVAYECQLGYLMTVTGRTKTSQCVMSDDGSQAIWTKTPVSCSAQSCGDPGFVANAYRFGIDFAFPHTVEFECKYGYKLKGTNALHCETSGMWSGKLPTCEKVTCDERQAPKHGFQRFTNGLNVGSRITYTCEKGKVVFGGPPSLCGSDGQWTHPPPKCLDNVSCGPPPEMKGAMKEHIGTRLNTGAWVMYTCKFGYVGRGSSKFPSRCEFDEKTGTAQWSDPNVVCIEIDVHCPEIDDKGIFNVRYNGSGKINSTVYYTCKVRKRIILGSKLRICQEDGKWSGGDPECVEPEFLCPEIDDKGIFTVKYLGRRMVNTIVYYNCNHQDQEIFGSIMRTCQEDGKWSGGDPECVAKVACSGPPQVSGAKTYVHDGNYSRGSTAIYTCISGYVSQGAGRFQSVCEFDEQSGIGQWSDPNVDCTPRRSSDYKPKT